jgi:predicted alpha/beta superfamily hydrolase
MYRTSFFFLLTTLFILNANAQEMPQLSAGAMNRLENFPSQYVKSRHVDVWLPPGYDATQKYTVLYMHDGQMLFDSLLTWNHQEWQVDETMGALMREHKIQNTLVVAIWNNGADRISEYLPNGIFENVSTEIQTDFSQKYCNSLGAQGDAYLKFVVEELKPYIDTHYATYTDAAHTFMMGSSMGGLISIHAVVKYPEVFGGVACLSTAWLSMITPHYEFPMATFTYLIDHLSYSTSKIYMDYGTGESDADYEATQSFINTIIRNKDYPEAHLNFKVFENDGHNEKAWSGRLAIPLQFLLQED